MLPTSCCAAVCKGGGGSSIGVSIWLRGVETFAIEGTSGFDAGLGFWGPCSGTGYFGRKLIRWHCVTSGDVARS